MLKNIHIAMKYIRNALSLSLLAAFMSGIHTEEVLAQKDPLEGRHPFSVFPEYKIMPGDSLDILFQTQNWMEQEDYRISLGHTVAVKFIHTPELNETQMVRPDGKISLPYLGEMDVRGKTILQLTEELKKQYDAILSKPELYVTIPDYSAPLKELKADLQTTGRGSSRLVEVRLDGYATFPLLGDIFVADQSIQELSRSINEKYLTLVPGLRVDIFLQEHAGSSVYVMGMVQKPGNYEIRKPISVWEAVATAGSYLPGAELGGILVIRKEAHQMVAHRVNAKKNLSKRPSDVFYLRPDDIVYVPRTLISKTAELAREITDIAFFKGIGLTFSYDLNDNNGSQEVIVQ